MKYDKIGMYPPTHESFTVVRGQRGKYGPRKEPIRLQDSLPCPLKKRLSVVWVSTSGNRVLCFSCGQKEIMLFDVENENKSSPFKKSYNREDRSNLSLSSSLTCWPLKGLWRLSLADSKDFVVRHMKVSSSCEECDLLSGGKLIRVAEITVTWTTCVCVICYV